MSKMSHNNCYCCYKQLKQRDHHVYQQTQKTGKQFSTNKCFVHLMVVEVVERMPLHLVVLVVSLSEATREVSKYD